MCGIDSPGPDRQRRRRPAIGANQRNQLRRGDDVDDRIDGAHLVKRDRVHRDAMHFRLRLSEKVEDRKRMLLHVVIEA